MADKDLGEIHEIAFEPGSCPNTSNVVVVHGEPANKTMFTNAYPIGIDCAASGTSSMVSISVEFFTAKG